MMAIPRLKAMTMPRPPLRLVAIALALSMSALPRAADDLVLSRFGDYLDALRVQARIPDWPRPSSARPTSPGKGRSGARTWSATS
jgi:hypothetical protein